MGKPRDKEKRPKKVSDMDRYVGERVRALRLSRGLSQTTIANEIGLTFQQVQKYEKGLNRISPGRLSTLARLFNVEIANFFPADGRAPDPDDPMHIVSTTKHGARLARAFNGVKSMPMRDAIVTLIEQVARLSTRTADAAE